MVARQKDGVHRTVTLKLVFLASSNVGRFELARKSAKIFLARGVNLSGFIKNSFLGSDVLARKTGHDQMGFTGRTRS